MIAFRNYVEPPPMYIYVSVGFGLYAVAITVIIWAIRKYLGFIKQLFEQVSKAISGAPAVLMEPILVFCYYISKEFSRFQL